MNRGDPLALKSPKLSSDPDRNLYPIHEQTISIRSDDINLSFPQNQRLYHASSLLRLVDLPGVRIPRWPDSSSFPFEGYSHRPRWVKTA